MQGHARHLMTDHVISVGPDASLAEIGRLLVDGRFGGVPVVDEDERVMGFVSQTDLLNALLKPASEDVRARNLMSHPPIVVDEFLPTDEVFKILREAQIHHLPVVRQGRLVGIITPHDILRYYVEHALPPPPELA